MLRIKKCLMAIGKWQPHILQKKKYSLVYLEERLSKFCTANHILKGQNLPSCPWAVICIISRRMMHEWS